VLISGTISCGTNAGGTASDKMFIQIIIDPERTGLCPKHGCSPQELVLIRSKISATLSSNLFSLNVELSNGMVISIVTKFCFFGSGKGCALQS